MDIDPKTIATITSFLVALAGMFTAASNLIKQLGAQLVNLARWWRTFQAKKKHGTSSRKPNARRRPRPRPSDEGPA